MIMTLADAQLAFPFILLAIGIIAVLGPSLPTLIVVIGLSGWVTCARAPLAGAGARSREFVDAIHALGGSVLRVIARHVLPNVLSSLVVIATLELARAIVLEATLSFLGLGVQPPTPSWGGMVQRARVSRLGVVDLDGAGDRAHAHLDRGEPHRDWLRDLLDPTLRGVAG
jgi:peptide/nickel transport system permease protein